MADDASEIIEAIVDEQQRLYEQGYELQSVSLTREQAETLKNSDNVVKANTENVED